MEIQILNSSNKKFWKSIKQANKLLLQEKGNLVSNEKVLTNTLNHFFVKNRSNLGLKDCETSGRSFENLENFLESLKDNPSVKRMKTLIMVIMF